tara:strand:- start:664 stop:1731 length:1068 start_codon:yes stop_codon:yes gene_type:complete
MILSNKKRIIILILLSLLLFLSYKLIYNYKNHELFEQDNPPFPIDIVIPWAGEDKSDNKANRDEGILKYQLRSILKNASWIRTIYIFKDAPDNYPSWLDENKSNHKIKIINRCLYFKNKKWCPTSHSGAIYLNMYKIPNLSEQFIICDDDVIFFKKLYYTDFFTKDGKKLLSQFKKNSNIEDIYPIDKIKKGNVTPPKSPKQFSGGDSHIPLPNFKSIHKYLNQTYSEWHDFVSSHTKRWCCCDDTLCAGGIENNCKSCYDELGGNLCITNLEAYNQNKAIYSPIKPSSTMLFDPEGILNILKEIKEGKKDIYYLNINNIGTDDLQKKKTQEYYKYKNKILDKLEYFFPKNNTIE